MTTINLHGILAKEFGKVFSIKIRKPKDAIMAIDINKPNFLKRITDLSKEGIHYAVLVDGEDVKDYLELEIKKTPSIIDIIPLICGAAGLAIAAIGAIGMYAAGAGVAAGVIGTGMGMFLGSLAATVLSYGVQMMLAPDPAKAGKAPSIEVGGIKESFIFGSKANLVEQGSPVPVGYGRLRVGSNVIATSVKSYPNKNNVENHLKTSKPPNPNVKEKDINVRIIKRS
jgi:predicted phage tail protein